MPSRRLTISDIAEAAEKQFKLRPYLDIKDVVGRELTQRDIFGPRRRTVFGAVCRALGKRGAAAKIARRPAKSQVKLPF